MLLYPPEISVNLMRHDLLNGRACLLVIDDQESQIHPGAFQKRMKRYGEMMPDFCSIAGAYMDVIHIAMATDIDLYKNQSKKDIYNQNSLKIVTPSSLSDTEKPPLTINFLHRFNPQDDLYLTKHGNSPFSDDILRNYIAEQKFSTILGCGVFLGACVRDTFEGLVDLQKEFSFLKNIAVISDLTDNHSEDQDIMEQHHFVKDIIGEQIHTVSVDNILSVLNPELDIDYPLTVNHRIIAEQRRPTQPVKIVRPLHP